MKKSKMISLIQTWKTEEIEAGLEKFRFSSELSPLLLRERDAMIAVLDERIGKEIDAITTEREDRDFLDSLQED